MGEEGEEGCDDERDKEDDEAEQEEGEEEGEREKEEDCHHVRGGISACGRHPRSCPPRTR